MIFLLKYPFSVSVEAVQVFRNGVTDEQCCCTTTGAGSGEVIFSVVAMLYKF
jgi:hypothetical protein